MMIRWKTTMLTQIKIQGFFAHWHSFFDKKNKRKKKLKWNQIKIIKSDPDLSCCNNRIISCCLSMKADTFTRDSQNEWVFTSTRIFSKKRKKTTDQCIACADKEDGNGYVTVMTFHIHALRFMIESVEFH